MVCSTGPFISQIKIFKMEGTIRQGNGLRDNLSIVTDRQNHRLEKFRKRRPLFEFMSFRIKMAQFLEDEAGYDSYIAKSRSHLEAKLPAAAKTGGHAVLMYVQNALIGHADRKRTDPKGYQSVHVLDDLKMKNDIPEHNPYKDLCHKQKRYLQVLAAEMGTIGFIKYMEQSLVQAEVITKDQKIGDNDVVYELNRYPNKCLDHLRILHLS